MDTGFLLSLLGLVFAATATPGPNNLVVLSLSVTVGPQQAAVASLGVLFGTLALLFLNWFGAVLMFNKWPMLQLGLTGLGSAYLLWTGITLCHSAFFPNTKKTSVAMPSSPISLALFQLSNPKAWILCIAAVSATQAHSPDGLGLILLSVLFLFTMSISLCLWILLGRVLPHKQTTPWLSLVLGAAIIWCSAMLIFSTILA